MASGRNVGVEQLLGEREWLRRLARHLAGQESDGEDLAQDAWVAAHRRPPDPDRPPRPWLAQVLRNLIQTRRRDDRRRARREREYHEHAGDRAAAVDDVYERLELQRFLVERVMALGEPLGPVVILRYFEGLDSARIGQVTGVAPGTVRWRLKQALDRLRGSLDERQGGDRRAWVVLLAPGAGSFDRAGTRTAPATGGAWIMANIRTKAGLISMAGVGLLAIAAVALWWPLGSSAGVGAPAAAGGDRAGSPGSPGSPGRTAVPPPKLLLAAGAADSEKTAAGCAAALAQARDEAEALEREARGLIPVAGFDAGSPNSGLRAEVVAQIDRLWPAAAAGQGITHRVECRGWACGLSVQIPFEESPEVEPRLRAVATWIPLVNRLPELTMTPPSPLGVAVQWVGSRIAKDRLAGKKLEEYTFFFGAPPGPEAAEEGAPVTPAPESVDACRRELASTRDRMRPRLAQLPAFRPLATQFAASTSSPELGERVQAAADRAGLRARVACRIGVCRLRLDQPSDPAALARLRADPELDERIGKEQQSAGDLYLSVGELGGPVLARLRAPVKKPGFFGGCPQPEREGNVLLRLLVPETGIPNENGTFGQASVQLAGGTLAGTPAASCLTERMAAVLAAQELPPSMIGFMRYESWTWRPGQPPRLVTP
jgi:RNA polymerase sigma-70 factor, ECF subfamily